jgi:hypothetical protein
MVWECCLGYIIELISPDGIYSAIGSAGTHKENSLGTQLPPAKGINNIHDA